MLDTIKHITYDNFFSFRKIAHRCIVCVTQSNWVKYVISCLRVLPGSAEAQVTWGGIVKRLLIAHFISNISVKKYQNPFTCVKVIASQRCDVFLRHGVDARNVVLTGVDSDLLYRRCTVSPRSPIPALAKLLFHVSVRPLKQIHAQLAAYRPSCTNGFRQNESRFRSGRTVAFLSDGISSDGIS